jgi:hypothetical protein
VRRGRRGFLLRLLGALPGGVLWRAVAGEPAPEAGAEPAPDERWLELVADAIVPGDDTPGAVAAGVVPRLIESIRGDEHKARLYAGGRALLEAAAHERNADGFAALSTDERSALLRAVGDGAKATPQARAFYLQARGDVLGLFYTSPVGWRGIGYQPPPYAYPSADLPGS